MSAAENIVDFIRGFGERKRAAQIKGALQNYLTDPDATIAAVNKIDAPTAIALNTQHTGEVATQQAQQDAQQKRQLDHFGQVTSFLRSARDNGQMDMGAALDSISPFLKTSLGASDQDIAGWKQAVAANPGLIDALDAEGQKARARLAGDVHVVGPGAALAVGGRVTYQQPNTPKVLQVPNASGGRDVITVDPNSPHAVGTVPPAQVGATPMTADALLPHFVAQESGGDYTARNASTGALGRYQVMPSTGQGLARKLGMAWRPDMMTSDDPAAQRYQDAIGKAAVQDAIDHSGGDPRTAFQYYYGGPDRSKWGPKTRKYGDDMMARVGMGAAPAPAQGGGAAVRPVYSTTGPGNAKAAHTLTPAELAQSGYPEGSVVQRDGNGVDKVTYKPPAPKAGAAAQSNPIDTYHESKSAIADIRANLIKLRDDPGLGNATGITGSVLGMIPGTHRKYLEGLIAQINAQKLVGLATALKSSGGNPFSRITNMEAQQLPKTLGNFDLNQSIPDLRRNINDAIAQLGGLEGRVDAAATRTGILGQPRSAAAPAGPRLPASNESPPMIGAKAFKRDAQGHVIATVQWNGKGWVPVRN